jgi:Zn-dependent protease
MRSSWKIGSAFGIGIYVHWTFFGLPAVVFAKGYMDGGYRLGLTYFAFILCAFAFVVMHELGHALMARVFGIRTRDITLYPIGGVARLERMSTRASEEILIAVAGPLVNVVLGCLLAMASIGVGALFGSNATPTVFVLLLAASNVTLVLFNMIPAFPMDGGRVLRALLTLVVDYVRATEIAYYLGVVLAVLFGVISVAALSHGNVTLVGMGIIAVFLIFAGKQELNAVRYRAALRQADPVDAEPADAPEPVTPADTGFSGYTWDADLHAYILWRNGRRVAAYPVPTE